jgi:hypothetical protein
MDAAEERAAEDQQTKDENAVLAELIMGSSAVGVLTERLGWKMRDGRPYVKRVYRALKGLQEDGMARKQRRHWFATKEGKKELVLNTPQKGGQAFDSAKESPFSGQALKTSD